MSLCRKHAWRPGVCSCWDLVVAGAQGSASVHVGMENTPQALAASGLRKNLTSASLADSWTNLDVMHQHPWVPQVPRACRPRPPVPQPLLSPAPPAIFSGTVLSAVGTGPGHIPQFMSPSSRPGLWHKPAREAPGLWHPPSPLPAPPQTVSLSGCTTPDARRLSCHPAWARANSATSRAQRTPSRLPLLFQAAWG